MQDKVYFVPPEQDNFMQELYVTAAVIRERGKILLASRPVGREMAGRWEFPGGKIHPGETPQRALRREIAEELNAEVIVLDQIFQTVFTVPGKKINLYFFRCLFTDNTPPLKPREGQEVAWAEPENLHLFDLLPADREFAAFLFSENKI